MKFFNTLISTDETTFSKGRFYEARAKDYLKKQGLREFQFNYHSRYGEIDLIAKDRETLVFIEVRYRKKQKHGSAAATVNFHKQQKLIKTAQHYLQKNGLTNQVPCRFDVIGITGNVSESTFSMKYKDNLEFQWIKNAF